MTAVPPRPAAPEQDWHTAFDIVRGWETRPNNYAPLIDAIARQLAAERERALAPVRALADEWRTDAWADAAVFVPTACADRLLAALDPS